MNALSLILWLILPPCAAEDSDNCKWNAQARGNGVGQSFVTIGGFVFMVAS